MVNLRSSSCLLTRPYDTRHIRGTERFPKEVLMLKLLHDLALHITQQPLNIWKYRWCWGPRFQAAVVTTSSPRLGAGKAWRILCKVWLLFPTSRGNRTPWWYKTRKQCKCTLHPTNNGRRVTFPKTGTKEFNQKYKAWPLLHLPPLSPLPSRTYSVTVTSLGISLLNETVSSDAQ